MAKNIEVNETKQLQDMLHNADQNTALHASVTFLTDTLVTMDEAAKLAKVSVSTLRKFYAENPNETSKAILDVQPLMATGVFTLFGRTLFKRDVMVAVGEQYATALATMGRTTHTGLKASTVRMFANTARKTLPDTAKSVPDMVKALAVQLYGSDASETQINTLESLLMTTQEQQAQLQAQLFSSVVVSATSDK